jgi:hypothetical protein
VACEVSKNKEQKSKERGRTRQGPSRVHEHTQLNISNPCSPPPLRITSLCHSVTVFRCKTILKRTAEEVRVSSHAGYYADIRSFPSTRDRTLKLVTTAH